VFPSVADVFYLAVYPFLMAGLLLLIRSRSPGADRASLLDALVVTVGIGVVSWVFLVGPLAHSPDLTLAERVVSMAYPIMDVLLLATVVRLVVDGGTRPPAFWVLGCGVGALLVTDTLYSIIQLTGGYHTGSPIDLGWMTWYACWGATALHPTMTTLAEPAPHREVRLSRWRLGLLAGASLLAPAVQVVQLARREHTEGLVTAVASMVLFGLVLARLQGLAGEVAALATGRKRLLDRTVQAREEERIRLAAELHDGPIQRLTGVAYTADLSRRRLARADLDGGRELLGALEDDIRGEVSAPRRVMVDLRPPALDEWGLAAALSDYAKTFEQQTGIACSVQASLPERLARAYENGAVPGRPGSPYQRRQACQGAARPRGPAGPPWAGDAPGRRRRDRLRHHPPGRPHRRPPWPQPLRAGQHAPAARDGRRELAGPLPPGPGHDHQRHPSGHPGASARQHPLGGRAGSPGRHGRMAAAGWPGAVETEGVRSVARTRRRSA
jgi:signal transduction histidine kinase